MKNQLDADTGPQLLSQVAALPWRFVGGQPEVCLITTRSTYRWTIPKGWPMAGKRDDLAAAIEAEQESGVVGDVAPQPFGYFTYWKRRDSCFDLVRVAVFPLKVRKTLRSWKEKRQRDVRWFDVDQAAALVDEPELKSLLSRFGDMLAAYTLHADLDAD